MNDQTNEGKNKTTLYCSFCGKSQHEVKKLIAGPTVFICDECVELCMDIIKEEHKSTRTKIMNNYYFLLINPNISLSTREVFQQYDASNSNESNIPDARFGNINIHNSLLSSAIDLAPQISSVLSHLQKSKTITAYGMTGSGSTCFGIFKNINEIIKFLEFFNKQDYPNYFIWYGQKKNYNMNRIRTSKTLENIV